MSYEKAKETAEFIRSKYDKEIKTAVVLGSGLGAFADEIETKYDRSSERLRHPVYQIDQQLMQTQLTAPTPQN